MAKFHKLWKIQFKGFPAFESKNGAFSQLMIDAKFVEHRTWETRTISAK